MTDNQGSSQPPLGLRQALRRLYSKLSRQRRMELIVVAALMLTSSLAEMLSLGAVVPFLAVLAEPQQIWSLAQTQRLAGALGWQQASDLVVPLCLVFAGASLLSGAVRLLNLRRLIRLANAIGSDLRIEVYRRILYQPYLVHLQRNSSETISAASNEVAQAVIIVNSILEFSTGFLVACGLILLLLLLNPLATLMVFVIIGGGYGLATVVSRKKLRVIGSEVLSDQTQLIRSLQEGIGAIRDVILNGNHEALISVFSKSSKRLRNHQSTGQFITFAPRYLMESVALVCFALIALTLINTETKFSNVFPIMGALALGAQRLLPTLQLIYSNWTTIGINKAGLLSVLSNLEKPILIEGSQADLTPLPLLKEIRFENVSFRYRSDLPWVIKNVSFSIKKGDRVGIVGETGSGKSTLVDLLMGLLTPTEGSIYVDGSLLKGSLMIRRWQSSIAHVPQTVFLADASVAQNIAFGIDSDTIKKSKLISSAQIAQICEFINTLPKGFQTPVGERGISLSGGQRQRLGIARSLYRDSSVLVFDEATSALDDDTETRVINAINSSTQNRTIIMIAHRLSTLDKCNCQLEIKKNSVSKKHANV